MKKFCQGKTFFWVFLLTVISTSLIFSTGLAYCDEWTVMVYVDGDNNLEDAAIDDFLEMATVGSVTDEMNIVVQLDRIDGYDTQYDNWTDTKRFYVREGMIPTPANAVQDLGEVDMADPAELTEFITWAINNYPADKYMLVLWNHGDGWRKRFPFAPRGVIWDDTNDENFLTMAKLLEALNNVGQKIDIVAFDACLMGMVEVAYTLSQLTFPPDYMVGSEEVEPGDGWPYDTILNELKTDPLMNSLGLATLIPEKYAESYGPDDAVTQSAIDINKIDGIDELTQRVDNLADAILDSTDSLGILDAFQNAQCYYAHSDYLDLYDLCEIIYQNVSDCATQASAVVSYMSDVIVAESHSSQGGVENSHGISIYGELPPESDYEDLAFADDTNWDQALIHLAAGVPPQNVVAGDGFNNMVPLTWDPFEGSYPDYYRVYRSEASGGPYELIASVDTTDRNYEDNEDYVDEEVTNGTTYYYIIKAVTSGEESEPSREVSATPSAEGKVLNSGYATSPPNINGEIEPKEWEDAAEVDIALYQGGIEHPISMKVMNDDDYLYIALGDENLTEEDWNDFYIFFDDDDNGEWPPGPSTTEGYFYINFCYGWIEANFCGIYGSYPDDINIDEWGTEATGVTVGCSFASGYLQYEIAIDLETSYLTADPGDTIGFWVRNLDDLVPQETYYYIPNDGAWPVGSVWVDPKTYAQLVLNMGPERPFTLTDIGSYPNPVYSGDAHIHFDLGKEANVTVKIYTVSGELIRNLVENTTYSRGFREIIWDMKNDTGERVARGVYIYLIRATTGGKTLTKAGKIAVIKRKY